LEVDQLQQPQALIFFQLERDYKCSYLRLTFLTSTDKIGSGVWLRSFEVVGKIIEGTPPKLEKIFSIGKEPAFDFVPVFESSKTNHNGRFNYFAKSSLKNRNNVFTIRSFLSKKQILFRTCYFGMMKLGKCLERLLIFSLNRDFLGFSKSVLSYPIREKVLPQNMGISWWEN
jgi:hypothetical protein